MKFMMLMIPNVYRNNKKIDPHFVPPADMLEKMNRYNEELLQAGLLKSMDDDNLNGLHSLTKGARVGFNEGKAAVTDGPMIEAKQLLGGYWLISAKSKEEVVKWAERCPAQDGDIIEIRQIFEGADFDVNGPANKGQERAHETREPAGKPTNKWLRALAKTRSNQNDNYGKGPRHSEQSPT